MVLDDDLVGDHVSHVVLHASDDHITEVAIIVRWRESRFGKMVQKRLKLLRDVVRKSGRLIDDADAA
jgi:hypothetical protein